jgi:hypothetical protein
MINRDNISRTAPFILWRFILASFILAAAVTSSSAFDNTHGLYGKTLSLYVKDGLVDYRGLKSNPGDLRTYLESTSHVTRQEFDSWSKDEQLAFLINLYNARTLELIVKNYPVKSIKDIGSGGKGPWEEPVVELFGETITLNALENGIIRKEYKEPRIHFALVCAAMGCPPLSVEPYVADKLDSQLEARTKNFLADPGKNSVDRKNKTIRLSPIFEWYAADFESGEGSITGFLKKYYGGLTDGQYIIVYTDYDWSLNDTAAER